MSEGRSDSAPPPRPAYGRMTHEAEPERDPWLPPAEPARARSIAEGLEPGALRRELGGRMLTPSRDLPRRIATFAFTGDGAQDSRTWVVNLLLPNATLGTDSACATVRKTRPCCQTTRLEGPAFEYPCDARAILPRLGIA